jgi:chromosome segregation ATPase
MALDGRVFELEMKLKDRQEDIQDLAKRQDALEKSLENAKFDIEFLKSLSGFADNKTDDTGKVLNTALNKLYETEHRLTTAEETIDALNLRLLALEARAGKPKAPVSKPTSGFIPATPATTPHPASKRSGASKPTAPADNPTPAVKEVTR